MANGECVLLKAFLLISCSAYAAGISCGWTGHHHRFGEDCELQCHCRERQEECDRITGNCTRTGCAEDWMGPGCQFRNAARLTAVDANYGSTLGFAVDGRHDTCTSQVGLVTGPFIRIALQYESTMNEVTVRFRNYTHASGFSVYIGRSTTRDQMTFCAEDPKVQLDDESVSVVCSKPMVGRFVTIILNGQDRNLEICEIRIPEGRHLSYQKPVYGSTQDANLNNLVSGKTDDHASTREQDNPWMFVDLLQEYNINVIEITNKEDSRADLIGFEVYLSNKRDFSDAKLIYTDFSNTDTITNRIYLKVSARIARYVRIALPGLKRRISLRELWVYGDCLTKRCGFRCDQLCYCDIDRMSALNRVQGRCTGPCDRNWRNENSFCNTSICFDDTFGYECSYDCHCNGTCHPWFGQCLLENDVCSKHYYGDRCQAHNMIRESKFTAQGNRTYSSADMTVDGLTSTCGPILGGQTASWTVPLGIEKYVDQILILVNENTTGYGFEVITENSDNFFQCDTFRKGNGDKYLARCRNSIATHIRLRTRSTIQICEVAVLECANGTFGEECDNQCFCYNGYPCNKTTGECPLGGCESGYYGTMCDRECIAGSYGRDCKFECGNCKDGAICDIFTGECPGSCQPGWQGGRCNIECRNGTYGEDCIRDCGWCMNGEPCDKATGECSDGCGPGYFTKNCSVECVPGRYSYNCNETCGTCKNGQICDRSDGYCRGGCELGKMPPLCRTDCEHMTYGEGCLQQCGDCRYNMTCDPVTGVCHQGCDPGVYVTENDQMCTQECVDGYYGYNCTQTCYDDLCAESNICNKSTGGCLQGCLYAGVQPPLCIEDCFDGSFGMGCQHLCGMCRDRSACNKTTGICLNDCEPGFQGPKCDISEWSQKLTLASSIALGFGIALAILGVAAAVVAVCVWRRSRTEKDRDIRDRKESYQDIQPPQRTTSLVSRFYENSMPDYENVSNLKNGSSDMDVFADEVPKGTVAIENLWNHIQQMKQTGFEFNQQFNELSSGLIHPCEVAKKAQNIRKNRYKEIFPYDHSRVKLDVIAGDDGNDYINACYISGYNRPRMYIAAQGPTEELVNDFWRLIWQTKCRKIVMLTQLVEQGKVKCCQYWPEDGGLRYGSVYVEHKGIDLYADYSIRTFTISTEDSEENRDVQQFHYESWPDRHVPDHPSSVIDFWSKVRSTEMKENVPLLVHCSAGIGRSGTFLALDYLVEQANSEGYVNIYQSIQNLRHQRVNMVQNKDQYIFLHDALAEALLCPGTPTPCEKFALHYKKLLEMDLGTRLPKLSMEFDKLQHVTKFSDSLIPECFDDGKHLAARSNENAEKNRVQNILPSDKYRPHLTTSMYDRNDYINAVYLPSYRDRMKYLITQNPLPDTCVDFWRMVYENKVSTIVTMDNITTSSEIFWPTPQETLTFIPFQLQHVTDEHHVTHIERTITLSNAEAPREKPRMIKQFECKFWTNDSHIPSEEGAVALLTMHEEMLKWQEVEQKLPIVVHCLNGADKSGLFCVVTSAIDRLKEEREVALLQTVKQVRTRRQQVIQSYEQYKFCHDTVLEFLKTFDTYSNFFI